MDIHKAKAFAQAYKRIAEYFCSIAPKEILQQSIFPEITGTYIDRIKIKFDSGNRDTPYQGDEFLELYISFKDELKELVLKHEKDTVLSMLKAHFTLKVYPHIKLSKIDVFMNDREELIELLETFESSKLFVNNLINDRGESEGYGLIGYYDSFKEQAAIKREQFQGTMKEADPEQKSNQQSEPYRLPKELDTVEAKGILEKAIKMQLVEKKDNVYRWDGTAPQLALFAEIASEKLNLKNKWKPFQELFCVDKLAQTRYGSKEKVGKVQNGEIVEQLFK